LTYSEKMYNTDIWHDKFKDIPNTCVLGCEKIFERDLSDHVRKAIEVLPLTENIIVTFLYEALHSIHWNVVFNLLLDVGYKRILLIDGGELPPILLGKPRHENIHHFPDRTLQTSPYRNKLELSNRYGNKQLVPERERTKVFISLARMVREERIYFTNKILNDTELYNKGIVSCGWGDTEPMKLQCISLSDEEMSRFPVTLGHQNADQHGYFEEFSTAMFNVVLESSIGMNTSRYYDGVFTDTDRLFITEKTTKAFYMHQIPIILGAPGIVQHLRSMGYDMFDEIVNHDYDNEDNIFKRCDMIFAELKRLSSIPLNQLNNMLTIQSTLPDRFHHNRSLLHQYAEDKVILDWIDNNF